ncbi:hypothetical protein A4A49_01970 [Nicotiana attenuata]|uniref:DUF4283 domain-containing protein n=1 Tax=Nicotiana attenuata TaxID=49451 RepID=A0A314L3U3_NICAT|nr:hypothetical protein A4A49_01970 [Nicotiana attenuata]
MATTSPSGGGKPSDQSQNERNTIVHHLPQVSSKNSSPAAADLQHSAGITVEENRLEPSEISHINFGPNLEIVNRGDCSSYQGASSHQFSANSTIGIVPSDLLQIAGVNEIFGDGVPTVQIGYAWYQNNTLDEENRFASSISTRYPTIAPILQSKLPASVTVTGVRQNDIFTFEQTGNNPIIGNASPTPKDHLCKVSSQSTQGIDHHDQLSSSDLHQLAGHGVPGKLTAPNQCQYVSAPQGIVRKPSAQNIKGPLVSNLQNSLIEHYSYACVRPNFTPSFMPIGISTVIGISSTAPKDPFYQVSNQSSMAIDHQAHLSCSELSQLAEHGAQGISILPNQCHSISAPLVSSPNPSEEILHVPNLSNYKNGAPERCSFSSVRRNVNSPLSQIQSISLNGNGPLPPYGYYQGKTKKHPTNPKIIPIQPNTTTNAAPQPKPIQNKAKQPENPPPPPPTVRQSYVTRLRAKQDAAMAPIEFSPPIITTKQGKPAVIFKREDYMVKFADRCKFTVVGKFTNTMPRMEVIRKSFIAQIELRGGVKIAHFNAKTVYIDLDNEYDHSTVWTKQQMYIQGQMMRIEAWNPIFKPNEDSPIVPVWIMIPELPWHLYYMEILSPLLSPVVKALFLDLASFQKTRGSVVKVKMQVDLTKDRPSHVWLGYDEDQDVNGDGQWLEVQYDNLPSYCSQYRHLGHSTQACPVKNRELELQRRKGEEAAVASTSQSNSMQKPTEKAETIKQNQGNKQQGKTKKEVQDQNGKPKAEEHQKAAENQNIDQQMPGMTAINPPTQLERSEDSGAQNYPNSPVPQSLPVSSVAMVEGGKEKCQETPRISQEGESKGVGLPHVLHECANAHLTDHRADLTTPATTTTADHIVSDQPPPENVTNDVLSLEEDPPDQQSEDLRKILKGKGKAHSAPDFNIQPPKPRNKPSQKKRQAMKRQNKGISINEPSPNSSPGFQSPVATIRNNCDIGSVDRSQMYKDPVPDPSLSQPLLETVTQHNEMSGGVEEENEEEMSEASEDEQQYDLIVSAISGEYQQEVIGNQGLSPRKYNLSPRLTRSKAAAVLEPFLDTSHINHYKTQLSMHHETSNINNKIWIFWDQDFTGSVINHDEQQLTVELRHAEAADPFHLTIIYAKCKPVLKRPLWYILRAKALTCTTPWSVIGDFNVIASCEEKIRGIPYQINKSLDFLSMAEDCGLTDLGYYGPRYTWSNGRGPCAIV